MSKTVLVVEDYDDIRELVRILIEGYGYRVREATNGLEALEYVKQFLPDLILMDISMPVMDGLEATREIRKTKKAEQLPIIAITAYGQKYHQRAIKAGCNDLIAKSVVYDHLESMLKQYLSE